MPLYKNTASQKITVFAFNKTTGDPVTGDAANITAKIGTSSSNDTNPTEISATDQPGKYEFDLTQAETNVDKFEMQAFSSTSNVVFDPISVFTFPAKVPATLAHTDVTGNVPANATQFAGQTITAASGVTMPSEVASRTNITGGTITTVGTTTNLTNAPPDSAGVTTLLSRLSSARAGYLDNLNVGGAVASQADVVAINQSASRRVVLTTLQQWERPETGATTYLIVARTYDADGADVNADSTPTLTVTGTVSGNLAANLSAATNPATGVYQWEYDVEDDATIEPILIGVSAVIGSATFTLPALAQVCDFVAATWTTQDRANLEAILEDTATTIPNSIAALPTDADVQTAATASLNAYDPPTRAELTTDKDTIVAAIGTRASQASVDTVDSNVDLILEDTATTIPGLIAALPAAIWAVLMTSLTTVGSIGKLIKDKLDVAVSTVSGGSSSSGGVCSGGAKEYWIQTGEDLSQFEIDTVDPVTREATTFEDLTLALYVRGILDAFEPEWEQVLDEADEPIPGRIRLVGELGTVVSSHRYSIRASSATAGVTNEEVWLGIGVPETTGGGGGGDVDIPELASLIAQAFDGTLTLTGPVLPRGQLTLTRGMDYNNNDNGRSALISDTLDSWPNLTSATPYLVIKEQNGQFPQVFHITGTVVAPTHPRSVRFELTAAQTAQLTQANYIWGVYAVLSSGRKADLVRMGKNLIVGEMPQVGT